MFLKYLKIYKGSELVREISFHQGVNFIVDNTPYAIGSHSGNNVGKTTVLRLIDYCLGSNGKEIYSDIEFSGKANTELKNVLASENYSVELCMSDLNSIEKLVIVRNFQSRKNKVIFVNDDAVDETSLRSILNKTLFNNENAVPSFRNLISKFIRNTPHKMSRTLRYLHPAVRENIYESVHLFLFGIRIPTEYIEEKNWLETRVKIETDVLDSLTEDGFNENSLRQALKVIERDIVQLNREKILFNISAVEELNLEFLNSLKSKISKLNEKNRNLIVKKRLILESVAELNSTKNGYDVEVIKDIYKEAQFYIPALEKRFEDVINFHDSMLENRIKFLEKDLPEIDNEIVEIENELREILPAEKELNDKLNFAFSFDKYESLINELNSRYELKGKREERYNQIVDLTKSVTEKSERLKVINTELNSVEPTLEARIELFNVFFSQYSKELYDEEFYLSHERTVNNFKLNIDNIQANVGGGKKKGQIAAFDLAYVRFCDELGLTAPRFFIHDSTEDVSINQLMVINNIANSISCQYIVAVLRDKFAGNEEQNQLIDAYKIIELSQSQKLFRI